MQASGSANGQHQQGGKKVWNKKKKKKRKRDPFSGMPSS
jgi:hypothetical protein